MNYFSLCDVLRKGREDGIDDSKKARQKRFIASSTVINAGPNSAIAISDNPYAKHHRVDPNSPGSIFAFVNAGIAVLVFGNGGEVHESYMFQESEDGTNST